MIAFSACTSSLLPTYTLQYTTKFWSLCWVEVGGEEIKVNLPPPSDRQTDRRTRRASSCLPAYTQSKNVGSHPQDKVKSKIVFLEKKIDADIWRSPAALSSYFLWDGRCSTDPFTTLELQNLSSNAPVLHQIRRSTDLEAQKLQKSRSGAFFSISLANSGTSELSFC